MSNGAQHRAIIGLVAKNKLSVDFCGYWQRSPQAEKEPTPTSRRLFSRDGFPRSEGV